VAAGARSPVETKVEQTKSMSNIYPEYERQLPQSAKEELLGQRGLVVWMYGLSGSGKSTIANAAEKALNSQGRYVTMLDGDNLRSGLNAGLGFSDEDRNENIRRAAEVAKLLRHNGAIVLVSLITPQNIFRQQVRDILGDENFLEVYVKASFEACQQRDVNGLYAKAKEGEVAHFSGKTSSFEEPDQADLVIETENQSIEQSLETLLQSISSNIKLDQISKG
jgi:adenylylsulfate kinase